MTRNITKKETEQWKQRADIWNTNFRACRERAGYSSQKAFAIAFKEKYGISNQADISRWERVGETVERNKQVKDDQGIKMIRTIGTIGFPSYENMKRIADFFGVTVGFLTGETDFKSFEMEQACKYFGISEEAGISIRKITKPETIYSSDMLLRKEHCAALEYMLSAQCFKPFIEELCMLAATIWNKQNPINHVAVLKDELDPYLYDLALKLTCAVEWDGPLDIPDTPEFEEVLQKVEKANHLDFSQDLDLDRKLKANRYTLYETYVKLIDEILSDSHLQSMSKRYTQKFGSVEEMRRLGEEEAKELSL